MPAKTQLPKTPTRERRVYLASARIYVNLFRAVFASPLKARRRFRRVAERDSVDAALDNFYNRPALFGDLRTGIEHAHDPAFVYWTQRTRRPRVLLKRAAAAIARELSRRDHGKFLEYARKSEGRALEAYNAAYRSRQTSRRAADSAKWAANPVYVDRNRAARAILRATRKHGARTVANMIEHTPEQFGGLKVNRVPFFRDVPILRNWRWLEIFQRDTHEEALSHVPHLVASYREAAYARADRTKAGRARRLSMRHTEAQGRVREMEQENAALGGGLKEAAQLIAILLRRRAVDEQPEGDKGPPPVTTQLAAMLPARAQQLIDDAVHMAEKESGDEHADWRLELAKSRGQHRGGWERDRGGRERERGGMSL